MSHIIPQYRNIQLLLQNQSFAIDEYQREYKWEKENIVELISDLRDKFFACYQSGHATSNVGAYEDYFLGSIIVSKRNNKNYLIDGQQRITSLTLLLIYLFHAAKEKQLTVVSSLSTLIYSDNLGLPKFNLDIPERLPVIEALFNQTDYSVDGKEESIQTMYARYEDIEREDLVNELGDALPHFIYWLMTKVGLIEISTDNDNYAYAIFETMNDRGKPLSPVDMLKAYLLAPIDDADKRKAANQKWKQQVLSLISWGDEQDNERDANCIKAWFRAQYAQSIRERRAGSTDKDWELIGNAFHRWARDNHSRLGWGRSDANLHLINEELPFYVNAFQTILGASKTYTPGLEAVFYNAHNEFTWQNTVLLAAICPTDDAETVRRKMAVTARYLDIWMIRRVVNYVRVGYSSSSYAMYLLCGEIRNKPLVDLVEVLTKRLSDDEVTFDGIPGRDRYGVSDLSLNQFSRRYIYHILARLTSYVEVQSGKPDLFDKYVDRTGRNPCDIEHIWANDFNQYRSEFQSQDEFQKWRNNIAGLLLLPADVNRSYQDKPFSEKAPNYATQNLYAASLNSMVYDHQPQFKAFRESSGLPFKPYIHFNREQQDERRELVKLLIEKIWSPNMLQSEAGL